MYRTYRNLYRVRPTMTSIGTGRGRIQLPKGVQITIDTVFLTILLWLPCNLVIGNGLESFFKIPSQLIGLAASILISIKLGSIDPAGKTVIQYLFDIIKYMIRTKEHDGFELKAHPAKSFDPSWKCSVALLEDNRCGSLPAKGRTEVFQILSPLSLKARKGEILIKYQGKQSESGTYETHKNTFIKLDNTVNTRSQED